jgi:hypothetical protein
VGKVGTRRGTGDLTIAGHASFAAHEAVYAAQDFALHFETGLDGPWLTTFMHFLFGRLNDSNL